jgi:hypothetical protein
MPPGLAGGPVTSKERRVGRVKVFVSGRHARRMPISYPALAPLFENRIERVAHPSEADMYVFAHGLDIRDCDPDVVTDWRARGRPVVLLSEEPFWDTIWNRRPLQRHRWFETRFGVLPVVQLNHQTSDIFDFAAIPYYLLTNHRFANAYAFHFGRNARVGPSEWRERFAARPIDVTFMFERRPEAFHSVSWPEGGLHGLCAWRTGLATAIKDRVVERLGRSWNNGISRFALADWHLDKLVRMADRARAFGAIENTHQRNYITEKFFDAFAIGSMPLYFADPAHRIHDFGLPRESWLNLDGLSVEDAADRVARQEWPPEFFEAYAEAQTMLADRFHDLRLWIEERHRLARATLAEFETVLVDRAAS